MTNTQASLRSDNCPICAGIGVRQLSESVSDFIGIRSFTQRGQKLALLLIQLRKRIYGPVAFGILRHRPNKNHMPDSSFERAYHKIDQAFDEAIELLAA